jgi:hypothetical protein
MAYLGRVLLLLSAAAAGWVIAGWLSLVDDPPGDLVFAVFIAVALWLLVLEPRWRKRST